MSKPSASFAPKVYALLTPSEMAELESGLADLSISDLKNILKVSHVDCTGCLEKKDLISKVSSECPNEGYNFVKSRKKGSGDTSRLDKVKQDVKNFTQGGDNILSLFFSFLFSVSGYIKTHEVITILHNHLRGILEVGLIDEIGSEAIAERDKSKSGFISEDDAIEIYQQLASLA